MIRTVLFDDHSAVRAGVQAILDPLSDTQLLGSAAGETAIWALLDRTRPDVLIMDVHHPGRDGLTLCLEIKRRPQPPSVVLYSGMNPDSLIVAAAVAGVDAIVSKSSPASALTDAIRQAAQIRHPVLSVTSRMRGQAAASLDPADYAIFAMRLAGDSAGEIGVTLGVPSEAVADRTRSIVARLARLNPAPRSELVLSGVS